MRDIVALEAGPPGGNPLSPSARHRVLSTARFFRGSLAVPELGVLAKGMILSGGGPEVDKRTPLCSAARLTTRSEPPFPVAVATGRSGADGEIT